MNRFKNILCVVDTNETCKSALERAVSLAENNQARLTVIEVVEDVTIGLPLAKSSNISESIQSALLEKHNNHLKELVAPFNEKLEIQTKVLRGTAFLEIIREVLRHGHDLVIKTPETLELLDRLFGGDDMHLLRKCPCPTWIIKPAVEKSYKIILAAIDVGTGHGPVELETRQGLTRQIIEMASSLALSDFAELHIVQVWHAPGEGMMKGGLMHTPEEKVTEYVNQVKQEYEAKFSALMQEMTKKLGQETFDFLKPQAHLVKGFARKEIPELASGIGADLIVMGTVGRTGVPGLLVGNTAEMILSQIDCSVLAVKPAGFKTPITVED